MRRYGAEQALLMLPPCAMHKINIRAHLFEPFFTTKA